MGLTTMHQVRWRWTLSNTDACDAQWQVTLEVAESLCRLTSTQAPATNALYAPCERSPISDHARYERVGRGAALDPITLPLLGPQGWSRPHLGRLRGEGQSCRGLVTLISAHICPWPYPSYAQLVTHDEGSCWVPNSIRPSHILSHWGRMDENHTAWTHYGALLSETGANPFVEHRLVGASNRFGSQKPISPHLHPQIRTFTPRSTSIRSGCPRDT